MNDVIVFAIRQPTYNPQMTTGKNLMLVGKGIVARSQATEQRFKL